MPNDLLASAFSNRTFLGANPTALKEQFQAAGKLQILSTQMTWVVGNIPEYKTLEMFRQALRTPAPITGNASTDDSFQDRIPTSVEDWIHEQTCDPNYVATLGTMEHIACRNGLYLYAPDRLAPRILVPPQTREPLIRFTHDRMFHLGHAKVAERLAKSYFWPDLRGDTRRLLTDCPTCELDKARRNEAHGLFSVPSPLAPLELGTPWISRGKAAQGYNR